MRNKFIKLVIEVIICLLFFSTSDFLSLESSKNLYAANFATLFEKFLILYAEDTKHIPETVFSDASLDVDNIVVKFREYGIPVGKYRVVERSDLSKILTPFICKLNKYDWIVVSDVSSNMVEFYDSNNKLFTLPKQNFLEEWDGIVIAQFPIGIWLTSVGKGFPHKEAIRFYIIYAYHDEDFARIKSAIDMIFEESKKQGKKIIYVDELGLIPFETIRTYSKTNNIPEKEAFEAIKKTLSRELEGVERGIPIYDSLWTYNNLYQYLANKKVKCVMEDLDYLNWQDIVVFDYLGYDKIASFFYTNGNIYSYANYMKKYCESFWKFNISLRDENFSNQVSNLLKENPDCLIFTIRGLGHLGLEEKLTHRGIMSNFIIIGDGKLEDNLTNQHLLRVYYNLGVKTDKIENRLFLTAFIQENLWNYFRSIENLPSRISILKTNALLRKISNEDVEEFSKFWPEYLSEYVQTKEIKNAEDIFSFVYHLVKKKVENK